MEKQCKKCLEIKSYSEFYLRNKKPRTYCKKCWIIISKKYCTKEYNKKYWIKKYNNIKKKANKYGLGAGTISKYGFKLSLEIYEKCDRKCVKCNSENDLTIHHLDNKGRNYEEKGLKRNDDIQNLIVLCRRCHGSIHGKEARGIPKTTQHRE